MRYDDEKYVEALEDEVKALRRRVGLSGSSNGGRGWGKTSLTTSAVATEEAYRRARTEIAAEAGAGYGRVSLEALYLLPTEFANAYQRLFLAALKESPGRTGEANPLVKKAPKLTRRGPGHENQRVEVKDEEGKLVGWDVAEVLDRDPDRGGGSARSGGRRHRDHWTISDERAFRLKGTVDDQLRELAEAILQHLSKRSDSTISRAAGKSSRLIQSEVDSGNLGTPSTPTCPGCRKFLKVSWKYCPHCGHLVKVPGP